MFRTGTTKAPPARLRHYGPRRGQPRVARSTVAPVQLANLGGPPGEIPVAPERPHPRLVGARHRDVRGDPVFGVADGDRHVLVLAADRRHRPVDDLGDLEDAGFAFYVVLDRRLPDAEEL